MKSRLVLLFVFGAFFFKGFSQTPFEQRISELGLSEVTTDWSDSAEIRMPKPKCAYVNVTGITTIPAKGKPVKGWLEVYDGNGNYFKKRVFMDGQGRTSRTKPKKNFEIDFCDDLWINDSTPDIYFGNWVGQDSYHFKAFHDDFFKADQSAGGYLRNGLLRGCYVARYVPQGGYVLQNHNGLAGFYRVADSGTVTVAPNRAFMVTDDDEGSAAEYVLDSDEVTGIDLATSTPDGIVGIYDLSGTRQTQLRKGLNLVRYSNGTTLKITVK